MIDSVYSAIKQACAALRPYGKKRCFVMLFLDGTVAVIDTKISYREGGKDSDVAVRKACYGNA